MKHCAGGQADQGEVLDDCCHVNSNLETLRSEGHVIIDPVYKHHIYLLFDKLYILMSHILIIFFGAAIVLI